MKFLFEGNEGRKDLMDSLQAEESGCSPPPPPPLFRPSVEFSEYIDGFARGEESYTNFRVERAFHAPLDVMMMPAPR